MKPTKRQGISWVATGALLVITALVAACSTNSGNGGGSRRRPSEAAAPVDPAALRVIKFTATETFAHDETPEMKAPFIWWEVANAVSVMLETVGEIPCGTEGLKESPPFCAGGGIPSQFLPGYWEAKGARRKALDALHLQLARATAVTLTARGADGKTLTTTVPVTSVPVPVEYVVTTGGWDGSVTVNNPETGATEQAKVYGPDGRRGGQWRRRYGTSRVLGGPVPDGAFLYLSGQNGDEGCVSVKIYMHNIAIKSAQSCGAFMIASVNTRFISLETMARLRGRAEIQRSTMTARRSSALFQ